MALAVPNKSNFAANMPMPTPPLLQSCLSLILQSSRQYIPTQGFSALAAQSALKGLREDTAVSDDVRHQITSPQILAAFPRGVEIALVEDVVKASNAKAKALLDAAEAAAMNPGLLASQEQLGGLQIPQSEAEVVFLGLYAKLKSLEPYSEQWHRAIVLEGLPTNAPSALLGLAEFCDTVSYYAERAEGRREGKVGPLSSSPHEGWSWYWRRAKIVPIYGSSMFHMMGDSSADKASTFDYLRWSVRQGF